MKMRPKHLKTEHYDLVLNSYGGGGKGNFVHFLGLSMAVTIKYGIRYAPLLQDRVDADMWL